MATFSRCALLLPCLLLFACTESSSVTDACPDTVACVSSNEALDGVWRIEEVIAVEGDENRAPAIGDILIYDAFSLRSFGNTDTSPESLELEAGPILDYRNLVDDEGAEFATTVSFDGLRPPVTIEIDSTLLAEDVLNVRFCTDLTEPTEVVMRLVKAAFLADAPGNPGVPLTLSDRAGTYQIAASDRPLPPVLDGGLLAVDLSGLVAAAFGRMPQDPRDFFDPSFVLNRSSGREIALQLTAENPFGELGTMSLRGISTDRDTLVAILVDDGLLDPLGGRVRYELALTRIANPELCGSVVTGDWSLRFFEGGREILDLSNDGALRSTRLYQAGCEIRIDSVDLALDPSAPGAGISLSGPLQPDATWTIEPDGLDPLGFDQVEISGAFTTTRNFTGTFDTADGRSGVIVGEALDASTP